MKRRRYHNRMKVVNSKRRGSRAAARRCVLFLPCYRDDRMLAGVCQFASEANWILDSFFFHTGVMPYGWDGDGVLCMLQSPKIETQITGFVRDHLHIPTVDLSRNDPSIEVPRVLQDNAAIGRLGAEHLVSRGCRHVGFVMHDSNSFHEERMQGFVGAIAAMGLSAVRIQAPNDFVTTGSGADWLTRHIPEDARPFGVMAAADYLTQWVCKACDEAGLSIPDDVALLGVDNCRVICELAPVGISSIDNNAFLHGYEGAKQLDQLMNGHPAPSAPVLIPPGALHVRTSTDILVSRHPHVATALKYIEDHYTDRHLTPRVVAAQVPMSERRLLDAFLKHAGRSVYQEIVHRRLQHALRLIQSTDQKLWDIAEVSGFTSPELMSRLFQRQLGHPPSSYRQ